MAGRAPNLPLMLKKLLTHIYDDEMCKRHPNKKANRFCFQCPQRNPICVSCQQEDRHNRHQDKIVSVIRVMGERCTNLQMLTRVLGPNNLYHFSSGRVEKITYLYSKRAGTSEPTTHNRAVQKCTNCDRHVRSCAGSSVCSVECWLFLEAGIEIKWAEGEEILFEAKESDEDAELTWEEYKEKTVFVDGGFQWHKCVDHQGFGKVVHVERMDRRSRTGSLLNADYLLCREIYKGSRV